MRFLLSRKYRDIFLYSILSISKMHLVGRIRCHPVAGSNKSDNLTFVKEPILEVLVRQIIFSRLVINRLRVVNEASVFIIESIVTPSGVIIANYKRAGKVKTGTIGS